jgi:hypothetical protein
VMMVAGEDEGKIQASVKVKIMNGEGDKPEWASSHLSRLSDGRWGRRGNDPNVSERQENRW